MNTTAKLAYVGRDCVACGCCVAACPRSAISIRSGITAQIDEARCVGCGKCAKSCPAAVIGLAEKETVR